MPLIGKDWKPPTEKPREAILERVAQKIAHGVALDRTWLEIAWAAIDEYKTALGSEE